MMSGMGDQVTLRPVSEDDLPVLQKLTQNPETRGEFEWAGWSDPWVDIHHVADLGDVLVEQALSLGGGLRGAQEAGLAHRATSRRDVGLRARYPTTAIGARSGSPSLTSSRA